MNLRNTVSVTPAIGASTVAGEMVTDPICKEGGTTRGAGPRDRSSGAVLSGTLSSEAAGAELSQNFRTTAL